MIVIVHVDVILDETEIGIGTIETVGDPEKVIGIEDMIEAMIGSEDLVIAVETETEVENEIVVEKEAVVGTEIVAGKEIVVVKEAAVEKEVRNVDVVEKKIRSQKKIVNQKRRKCREVETGAENGMINHAMWNQRGTDRNHEVPPEAWMI